MQAVAEGHDTAWKKVPVAPLGLRTGDWTVQVAPFQRSTRADCPVLAL
jgi:hypothetical protein